ncbi:hypothetical protein ACIBG7_14345 [Nonomuraea sp. NPDC050328]|uniref:hypothetical protein n=1 Tax=Nonomuraea sp. NPDC050328 TaxID=3364361 RepID=UPI0037B29D5E
MTGRLRRAWDDLRGASGARIVALVSAQIATARAGAVLTVGRVLGDPASVTACALAARKAGSRVRQHLTPWTLRRR